MMRRAMILGLAMASNAMPVQAAPLGPDAEACRPGSGRNAVLLTIDGFKSRDGNVRVELWPGTEGDFLRNHHELVAEGKAYERVTVPTPMSGPAQICVPLPGPGTYALGAFHSPSGERKFNFRQDGATFTRNPKVGVLNTRPKAKDVAVTYGPGLNREAVTLNYLKGLSFRPIPRPEVRTASEANGSGTGDRH